MNKDLITKILLFTTGAAVGSAVSWMLVKTKYEKTIEDKNEEIEFLRDRYSSKDITIRDVAEAAEKEGFDIDISLDEPEEPTIHEISEKVRKLRYNNESYNEEEDEDDMCGPEVIAPEESWEQDYPVISLTYYEEDGVLVDEHNKIIGNAGELVGEDFADHFGEYEDDSVFIRNRKNKVYYEILKDYGSYSDSIRG